MDLADPPRARAGDRFNFGRPDVQFTEDDRGTHSVVLRVAGRKLGLGQANTQSEARDRAVLDCAVYIERCDPELWAEFRETRREAARREAQ